MSNIEQFPKNSYWLVASSSVLELGSYELSSDGDLSLVQFRVYNKCAVPYSYQIRLVVSSAASGHVLASSDWFEFSNATTGQVGSDWVGDIALDFNEYTLMAGETYFLRIELTGYTRPSAPLQNTKYFAVWADWLQPVGLSNTGGARVALGVKR